MNPDFSELTNEDILQKLDDGSFMDRFENSDDWKLFREACLRLSEQAQHELLTVDPIKDPTGVIERQVVAKFCGNVFQAIVNSFKNEGKVAFDEARIRGIKLGPMTITFSK